VTIKVFISHQQSDSARATLIAKRLRSLHQIESYLDVIDPAIAKSGEALTEYVRLQLGRCTQLLAVVSAATKASWWVPWEIGVATEKDFPLATFGGDTTLPEYLHKWPVLKSDRDLDSYAAASKAAERQFASKRVLVEAAVAQRSAARRRSSTGCCAPSWTSNPHLPNEGRRQWQTKKLSLLHLRWRTRPFAT
jgi:hypothetical protein